MYHVEMCLWLICPLPCTPFLPYIVIGVYAIIITFIYNKEMRIYMYMYIYISSHTLPLSFTDMHEYTDFYRICIKETERVYLSVAPGPLVVAAVAVVESCTDT